MIRTRMPVIYLPHGGGPWPFVEFGVPRNEVEALGNYLRALPADLGVEPKALLIVSAHWEQAVSSVMTGARPAMYYDYYGFPPESYEILWPAPGAPELAMRVRALLSRAGFETAEDSGRGFDHGTFVPMKVAFPNAEIPTIQLSLRSDLDPGKHIEIGRALSALREENVLIVGSGMSFHNMRGFGNPEGASISRVFDAWLGETVTSESSVRNQRLIEWETAPMARKAHPREEHLLPLMVAAGAAEQDLGHVSFRGTFAGATITAFRFG